MKKILYLFNKNKKEKFCLLFLSYIFSFCMFTYVNQIVLSILPNINITVSSYDKENTQKHINYVNYITILETEDTKKFYNLETIYKKNEEDSLNNRDLKYIKKGELGYSTNAIHMNSSQNKISFLLKKVPNAKVVFYNVGLSKKIKISFLKSEQIIDLSKLEQGEILSYFPFSESKLFIFYSFFIHFFIGIFIFLLITFIININLNMNYKISKFFMRYSDFKIVIIIYLIISLYVTIKMKTGTLPKSLFYENGRLFGDQGYYWDVGTYLKNFDIEGLKVILYTFRGYFSSIIPMISQLLEDLIKVNSLWIYYLINNLFTAFLLGYIIPELHYKFTLKKVKNYQVLVLFFLFFFFWKGMFYSVLADMLGITCAMYSLLLFIKNLNKVESVREIILSGICLAIAILNRSNFIMGMYVVVLFFIYDILFKRRYTKFFLYFFIGLFVVCIPQIILNYHSGHIGLFSYDKVGSFLENETLKQTHLNLMGTTSFVAWPYHTSDITAQKIFIEFSGGERITFNQGLSMFSSNMISTFIIILKKIFLSFDLKTSEIYPLYPYKSTSEFYFFSLCNYFILLSAIYLLVNKKNRNIFFSKKELIIGSAIYIIYMLPQLILDIEWRYYILVYLIFYYIFSFKLISLFEKEEGKIEYDYSSYLQFLCIMIPLCFVISSFYY